MDPLVKPEDDKVGEGGAEELRAVSCLGHS